MMGSFVEAQNNLKRMSYAGCVTLFKTQAKPRSSLLVHNCGHEVTGLKTYRGPKRKEQLGVCSLPGYYVPEVVSREFCLGRARLLSRYKKCARDRATRRAGWRRNRHARTPRRQRPTTLE